MSPGIVYYSDSNFFTVIFSGGGIFSGFSHPDITVPGLVKSDKITVSVVGFEVV